MIVFTRTASIAPGMMMPAQAFGREIAGFIKDKNGTDVELLLPWGGNPNRIGWSARYASLAAMETAVAALLADRGYQELVASGGGNFVAGSLHDEIWRTI